MIKHIMTRYEEVFGPFTGNVYFAPGRVNLIGEHTDYNGGYVFPCALNLGTYLAVSKRNDKLLRFYSDNFQTQGIIEVYLENIKYAIKDDWTNYPKGVIKVLKDLGCDINQGLNLMYYGNIPNGAGLSSSASIEMVTAIMLNDLFNLQLDKIDLVKYAQNAENKFVGVNCGIMDQFAIGMGKENHAILLNTKSLVHEYVPLELAGYKLIVTNTNKRRGLQDSKYNERRSQCEEAVDILKKHVEINSLGDLTIAKFNEYSHFIVSDIIRRRARHIVYENNRTIEAKKALEEKNLKLFGQLMNKSHISLRDDYEVTGIELDTLASLAWSQLGVIGSRMTGAGFGGCTISIVRNEFVDAFMENIEVKYTQIIGYKPSFYIVKVADGAKKLIEGSGI